MAVVASRATALAMVGRITQALEEAPGVHPHRPIEGNYKVGERSTNERKRKKCDLDAGRSTQVSRQSGVARDATHPAPRITHDGALAVEMASRILALAA